jgi:hypothetical protein
MDCNERTANYPKSSLYVVSLENGQFRHNSLPHRMQPWFFVFFLTMIETRRKYRTHLFPLLVKIPPMQPALSAKFKVRLRLQQRDLSYGTIDKIIVWFQTKGLDDEFTEIIVVWWRQSLLSPSVEKGIRVERRGALR